MWIKLCHLNIIFGVIYRHPKSNAKLFVDELNKTLEQLKTTKVYLIGDININIFSINNAKYASDYVNMLASNGYFPLITLPTRVNDVSSTLIDHLITNDHKNSIFPGIIKTDLTDLYPIFCSINAFAFSNKLNQQMYKRDLLNFNAENFCEDLPKSILIFFPQDNAINPNNLNIISNNFINIVKTAIDNYAPLKKLSRRQRKLKLKPWITRGLLISIKHKQKLYLSHFINGNTEKRNFYKKYANELNKINFISEQMFYQDELYKSKNNTFKTWKVIKSLLSCSQNSSTTPNEIKYNGNVITGSETISESFNSYFSKAGLDLSAKFNQHDTNSYKKFLPKFNSSSLFIQPTSETEVIQLIHSLKNKNLCGPDKISAKFVILAADILATPLKILFNYMFEFGIFPNCFKTAKVIPIYKQGDKMEMGNYRPISILSTFSKILEKLIYNRTQSFLEKLFIILPTQYGFRPAYSTSHAMTDILTSTLDNINVNKNTALLLLDLKKAFDTVNHDILLNKMNHYDIRGIANSLFASFLANRKQYVFLNHTQSNYRYIKCGVP